MNNATALKGDENAGEGGTNQVTVNTGLGIRDQKNAKNLI